MPRTSRLLSRSPFPSRCSQAERRSQHSPRLAVLSRATNHPSSPDWPPDGAAVHEGERRLRVWVSRRYESVAHVGVSVYVPRGTYSLCCTTGFYPCFVRLVFTLCVCYVPSLLYDCAIYPWCCRTVWYELLSGDWPFKSHPPEAVIWQVGKGVKQSLSTVQASRDVKVRRTHTPTNSSCSYIMCFLHKHRSDKSRGAVFLCGKISISGNSWS